MSLLNRIVVKMLEGQIVHVRDLDDPSDPEITFRVALKQINAPENQMVVEIFSKDEPSLIKRQLLLLERVSLKYRGEDCYFSFIEAKFDKPYYAVFELVLQAEAVNVGYVGAFELKTSAIVGKPLLLDIIGMRIRVISIKNGVLDVDIHYLQYDVQRLHFTGTNSELVPNSSNPAFQLKFSNLNSSKGTADLLIQSYP